MGNQRTSSENRNRSVNVVYSVNQNQPQISDSPPNYEEVFNTTDNIKFHVQVESSRTISDGDVSPPAYEGAISNDVFTSD